MPGHSAGVISWRTSPANLGPHGVHGTRRRYTDIAHQGRTAIAVAPHSPVLVIDERTRDSSEISVVLQREPRPLPRKRAARAAGPAHSRLLVLRRRRGLIFIAGEP